MKVFSAHRHIEALRGEIEKAMEEKRTDKPCGMLKDVHDVKSTAWRIDEQGQKIPVSFPAKFTYMSFLMITIPFSQEENRVMCTAKVELNEKTGVWRQFNGYDSWKHSINCQGEGILMDPASRFVHSVYVANQHEASLDFIIRPDQGRTITVMGIQIQTGKA